MRNPILPGFHADPSICRKGDDYYLAVSSFEWFPGIPIYHSRDLKHWELLTHGITDDREADLLKLPSAKGIWAPCLTWCEQEGLFYLTYSVMHSMNVRYFDVDNFVKTAPEITGPWSEPVYLHSAGFDASMFHDTDGRKYVVALDWETRETYEKPGAICLMEYDPRQKKVVGPMKRIYTGGTDRGCIEGPHLTKRGDWYYLMCAEGGTGYAHAVTMARSASVWGPYEPDPQNPIVTSVPGDFNERQDWDHLKPRYFNAVSYLQKSGHGSYVDTPLGETYLVHLCARPFRPELRCTLGRETAMQKMTWTGDGWLRMADGGNLARAEFEPSRLPEVCWPEPPVQDDFDGPALARCYYAPRWAPERFATLADGALYLRGQESLCSLNKTSLLARKLTSVETTVTTRMQFCPTSFHHSAGLVLYYDNMDYAYQAILNGEDHVKDIDFLTTLAGYVHWQLTGQKVLGIGDAAGIFPIDSNTCDYDAAMMSSFDELLAEAKLPYHLRDLLPQVLCAGQDAGILTEAGAKLLDPTGTLQPGAPVCPPEGDAGTGMAATNTVAKRTGNVSAGTSIFAMVVLEKPLQNVYPEIDLVTTPDGAPVAMVHCNNCTSDLNAWVNLFGQVAALCGAKTKASELFPLLFNASLEGAPDCSDVVPVNYYSGEGVTHFDAGHPMLLRTAGSDFSLANLMRAHIYSAMATLKIGLDILQDEKVAVDRLLGHGGLFKTPGVAQRYLAAAAQAPVTVMETAGEGGPYGMALLAGYRLAVLEGCTLNLADYLQQKIFADAPGSTLAPQEEDVRGFTAFLERYKAALHAERAAVEHF